MLFLELSGYNYSKKLCESVVSWFIQKYLPRHKLEIEVSHRGMMREGFYGLCTVQDCDYRPRSFLIELHNKMNREFYIQTLLHELVHVRQHVRGELKDRGSKRLWKGVDHSATDYDDQPWEVEAYDLEVKLCKEYLKDLTRVP